MIDSSRETRFFGQAILSWRIGISTDSAANKTAKVRQVCSSERPGGKKQADQPVAPCYQI
jgi:hypothetical protein